MTNMKTFIYTDVKIIILEINILEINIWVLSSVGSSFIHTPLSECSITLNKIPCTYHCIKHKDYVYKYYKYEKKII